MAGLGHDERARAACGGLSVPRGQTGARSTWDGKEGPFYAGLLPEGQEAKSLGSAGLDPISITFSARTSMTEWYGIYGCTLSLTL